MTFSGRCDIIYIETRERGKKKERKKEKVVLTTIRGESESNMLNVSVNKWWFSNVTGYVTHKKITFTGVDKKDFFTKMVERFGENELNLTTYLTEEVFTVAITEYVNNHNYIKNLYIDYVEIN